MKLTASVTSGSPSSETSPITVTDTFPSQFTPTAESGTGWNCAASTGQTVSCTYPASTGSPIVAGTTLPVITVATTVGATLGAFSETAYATSLNASQVSAVATGTVIPVFFLRVNMPPE